MACEMSPNKPNQQIQKYKRLQNHVPGRDLPKLFCRWVRGLKNTNALQSAPPAVSFNLVDSVYTIQHYTI